MQVVNEIKKGCNDISFPQVCLKGEEYSIVLKRAYIECDNSSLRISYEYGIVGYFGVFEIQVKPMADLNNNNVPWTTVTITPALVPPSEGSYSLINMANIGSGIYAVRLYSPSFLVASQPVINVSVPPCIQPEYSDNRFFGAITEQIGVSYLPSWTFANEGTLAVTFGNRTFTIGKSVAGGAIVSSSITPTGSAGEQRFFTIPYSANTEFFMTALQEVIYNGITYLVRGTMVWKTDGSGQITTGAVCSYEIVPGTWFNLGTGTYKNFCHYQTFNGSPAAANYDHYMDGIIFANDATPTKTQVVGSGAHIPAIIPKFISNFTGIDILDNGSYILNSQAVLVVIL